MMHNLKVNGQNKEKRKCSLPSIFIGGYSEENALMMRAKINFYGKEVGEHQNIILFIGAVVDNNASKFNCNGTSQNTNDH